MNPGREHELGRGWALRGGGERRWGRERERKRKRVIISFG